MKDQFYEKIDNATRSIPVLNIYSWWETSTPELVQANLPGTLRDCEDNIDGAVLESIGQRIPRILKRICKSTEVMFVSCFKLLVACLLLFPAVIECCPKGGIDKATQCQYSADVKTADVSGGGTNNIIKMKIADERWITLDKWGVDDLERNHIDTFTFYAKCFDKAPCVTLRSYGLTTDPLAFGICSSSDQWKCESVKLKITEGHFWDGKRFLSFNIEVQPFISNIVQCAPTNIFIHSRPSPPTSIHSSFSHLRPPLPPFTSVRLSLQVIMSIRCYVHICPSAPTVTQQ
ncbi:hypothetical protein LSAT2_015659 [Lamellibrachia satsuma]|nr:hypothetical protein LSAT2_015659 [Lamellibrachia satsuma]